MNKCPKCGAEYEGNFCPNGCNSPKVCPKCGTQYVGNFCPNGCNSSTPKKKKFKWWVVLLIVLGALLVIGIISGLFASMEPVSVPSSSKTSSSRSSSSIASLPASSSEEEPSEEESSKAPELSEEEYRAQCEEVAYSDLARNPDKYAGKYVKMRGEVIQELETEKTGYTQVDLRINVTEDEYGIWTDTVYAVAYLFPGEDRILEDDIITIYGMCDGSYTYTTVMGNDVTLPLVYVAYYDIETE